MNKVQRITITLLAIIATMSSFDILHAETMSSHSNHTLMLTENGTKQHVISFGRNNFMQVGQNTERNHPLPIAVQGLPNERIVSVEAGYGHSFAITELGRAYAWGSNYYGQLGIDPVVGLFYKPGVVLTFEQTSRGYVTGPLTNIKEIAAGKYHSLAIREDGSLWSFGNDDYDQLGNRNYFTGIHTLVAQRVGERNDFLTVESYGNHSFALDDQGTIWGFGENRGSIFQMSMGHTGNMKKIDGLPDAEDIATGNSHAIALDVHGEVWSWGYDNLPSRSDEPKATPLKVASLSDITSIDTGATHNLALDHDGRVYGWGENNYGELAADPDTTPFLRTPEEIDVPGKVIEVEAGEHHSLFRTDNGKVYALGWNRYGQLGDGTRIDQLNPVEIGIHFVTGIDITEAQLSLEKGETHELDVSVYPDNAIDKTVQFSSSNEEVVTVDDEGTIKAVGKDPSSNEAVITAETSSGGYTDTARVHVDIPAERVDIIKNALTLERTMTFHGMQDESYTLEADVFPKNATDKRIIWTSEDPSIVSVNPQGRVTARGVGETTVTATTISGGHLDTIPVEVVFPVDAVHIKRSDTGLSLWPSDTYKLDYYIYPEEATNQRIYEWMSSDPSIASVNSNGEVTAHNPGTTTVSVTTEDKRKTGTIEITVKQSSKVPLSGFSLEDSEVLLPAQTTHQVAPVFYPSNASNQRITWTSSDESIAEVRADGTIYGKATGTTTIQAKTEEKGFERHVSVTVTPTEQGWNIFPEVDQVSLTKAWTIDFTHDVDKDTVEDNVYIQDANGKEVATSVSIGKNSLRITPVRPLENDSYYYLIVSKGLMSDTGILSEYDSHMMFHTVE